MIFSARAHAFAVAWREARHGGETGRGHKVMLQDELATQLLPRFSVVRVGTTIATFTSQNVTATAASPVVPRDVVHRQVTALESAAAAPAL
ncbi:hypothetical protein [Streptomyces sp. NPDC057909]|uniref:hypothetical protein n=1 Tax=Streptomyces sp. NPDC057909 TaxID=3346277 RepID=UPI0036E07376